MASDVLCSRFSDEIPNGVPQGVVGGGALLEVEGPWAVCRACGKAVPHGWEAAAYFGTLQVLPWKTFTYNVMKKLKKWRWRWREREKA